MDSHTLNKLKDSKGAMLSKYFAYLIFLSYTYNLKLVSGEYFLIQQIFLDLLLGAKPLSRC